MHARELLRDRDRLRITEPPLHIKLSRGEIGQLESAERSVRENVDAEHLEIFAWQIRQRDNAAHERRRRGNPGMARYHWKHRFRQTVYGLGDLQLGFSGDQVNR